MVKILLNLFEGGLWVLGVLDLWWVGGEILGDLVLFDLYLGK